MDENFLEGVKLVLLSILLIFVRFQVVGSSEGSWGSFLFCLGLPLGGEDDMVLNQAIFAEWLARCWGDLEGQVTTGICKPL